MAKLTLVNAQRMLLGIIASVEVGVTSPVDAVEEVATLKAQAEAANLAFQANYTLADFEKIRTDYVSNYDSSEEFESSSSSY
jgi:hypothetical protein